ncbi:PIN-like domain-containing protein [Variovorax atrisoli]|uniref:PIN-like domain-containing protein n=1 Tax=Variovorax atrisoli TaxID=3394203 RepID=UPI00403FEB93
MKDLFRGRYRPTTDEFKSLWDTATISVDANVLLATYEFSNRARNDLLGLFRNIRERLFVPYQFAEEYQTKRIKVIGDQLNSYSSARTTLQTLLDHKLKTKNKHPFVAKTSIQAIEKICNELKRGELNHKKLLSADPHHRELSDIFEGRIAHPPSAEQKDAATTEARSRRDKKIPPGYEDNKKPEPACFGDYFGWSEIVKYGAEKKVPLIFVTGENKPDWWHVHGADHRIGPRHELIEEYFSASGEQFYMYHLAEFMRHSKKYLHHSISAATLQEVEERTFEDFVAEIFQGIETNIETKPSPSAQESEPKKIGFDSKASEPKSKPEKPKG